MNRTERFYRIKKLLHERRLVTRDEFLDDLGISWATFKRDLDFLRDRMHVPIVWSAKLRGYQIDSGEDAHELPGLWFNASEIYALLTMRRLLQDLSADLLAPHVAPLIDRFNELLVSGDYRLPEVERRVRILHIGQRAVDPQYFGSVSHALLERRRLRVTHFNRGTESTTERTLSPQRLIHYRENWYLDAYCHLREDLRSFSVDAFTAVECLGEPALEIDDGELDRHLAAGYGIFGGAAVEWAKLRFSPERARWISREVWHPDQKSTMEETGHYLLEIPYSDSRELLMDVLRHGTEVEILAPESLRQKLAETARELASRYD